MELKDLTLPLTIVGSGDVKRLMREVKSLDDYLKQAELRHPGTPPSKLPKTTSGLNEFAEINKLNLLLKKDRAKALEATSDLIAKAPVVHISFASDPSSAFMAKITNWFRSNIDHLILISVGLEPSIAAGCTIRTDNHFHDFSLREHFDAQRGFLLDKIKEA